MSETAILNRAILAGSKIDTVLFRNNVGMAYAGNKVVHIKPGYKVPIVGPATVILDAHPIKFGLGEGSSDLIGWKPIKITPEMVGRTIAAFTALECKSIKGRLSGPQKNFLAAVEKAGGIQGVIKDPEQIDILVLQYLHQPALIEDSSG